MTHWLTSVPTPYVHHLANIQGIERLSSIKDLCAQDKKVICLYLRYFHRICVIKGFDVNIKFDIFMEAMDKNGNYKPPKKYVIYLIVFIKYTFIITYIVK